MDEDQTPPQYMTAPFLWNTLCRQGYLLKLLLQLQIFIPTNIIFRNDLLTVGKFSVVYTLQ